MHDAFETRLSNMHTLYMQDTTKDADDVLEWMWSFLILSGTAIYVIERPVGAPLTNHDVLLFRYLDNVVPLEHITPPWTNKHAYEWLMQAGELRLWLNDDWTGQWDALGMDAFTRDFVAMLNSQL